MRARDFFKIYGSLLILHLAVVYVGESELLMRLSKYLLVFSLLVWYSSRQERPMAFTYFKLALLASLIGDIFLSFSGEGWFISGLTSFLVAHVFYTLSFARKDLRQPGPVWLKISLLAASLALLGFALSAFLPNLGDLAVPVIIYSLAILAMWNSTNLLSGNPDSWPLMLGASLFVLSDIILGYNKFHTPLEGSELMIMSSYGAGQGLMTYGLLRIRQGSAS